MRGRGNQKNAQNAVLRKEEEKVLPRLQILRDGVFKDKFQTQTPLDYYETLILEARQEEYELYKKECLNYRELQSKEEVEKLAQVLKEYNVKEVAIDFETARGANGEHGVEEGRLRLIQVGIDHPAFKGRRQWLIDCDQIDPRPIKKILENPRFQKIIHWSPFEQEWAQTHLGCQIRNVYDTAMAFQSINKELRTYKEENREKDIKQIIDGWEWHPASMQSLCDRHLGISLPKENQDSDWGGQLTEDQKDYAAIDVSVPFDLKPVAERLARELDIAGRVWYRANKIAPKEGGENLQEKKEPSRQLAWKMLYANSQKELQEIWQNGVALNTGIGFKEKEELRQYFEQRQTELV